MFLSLLQNDNLLLVIHKLKKNENLLSRIWNLLFIQILILDIIFCWTKFSDYSFVGKIFVTYEKFSHFCPTMFCPDKVINSHKFA